MEPKWQVRNPEGRHRVIVTRHLPGQDWIKVLQEADCKIEIWQEDDQLSTAMIKEAIGKDCRAAIGMLSEQWGAELFTALKAAGGRVYSNYAVGFNNIDLDAATAAGIAVGNTPGVLTGATAELAVALTLAAARRVGEAERFLRAGRFRGWAPTLLLGNLLEGKTAGIIGAGRIGTAYARIMVQGFRTNIIYYSRRPNSGLEDFVSAFGSFLKSRGHKPVVCTRAASVDELLKKSDCVSLHTPLNQDTFHLIDARRLGLMKKNAILINTSRGPVIDEAALVEHCRANPDFRAGLDVYENEPRLAPGLADLENAVLLPHLGSATHWTRQSMAVLAARNLAAILRGWPAWDRDDMEVFLLSRPPAAAPSILNARQLGIARFHEVRKPRGRSEKKDPLRS